MYEYVIVGIVDGKPEFCMGAEDTGEASNLMFRAQRVHPDAKWFCTPLRDPDGAYRDLLEAVLVRQANAEYAEKAQHDRELRAAQSRARDAENATGAGSTGD